MHKIPVLKILLLLLHVIPVLNKTGPTHTRIRDMIFATFSTFEINAISYETFVYYSVSQKKITFDEILKFDKNEQLKYLVLESINDKYYGFNLKMKLERKTAKEIVLGNWTLDWEFQFSVLISGTPIGGGIPIPFTIPKIPVGIFI